jgi:hypothetical protein
VGRSKIILIVTATLVAKSDGPDVIRLPKWDDVVAKKRGNLVTVQIF